MENFINLFDIYEFKIKKTSLFLYIFLYQVLYFFF